MGYSVFPGGSRRTERPLKFQKTSKEIAHSLPAFELHSEDVWWQSEQRCKVVVDNSMVVGVATGTVELVHSSTEHVFRRIGNIMCEPLEKNWLPQHDGAEFVVWRRRSGNKQADHIANVALRDNQPACVVLDAWHQASKIAIILYFSPMVVTGRVLTGLPGLGCAIV